MKIQGALEITIRNQDGSIAEHSIHPVRSFVIGFIKALAIVFSYDWYDILLATSYVTNMTWTGGATTSNPGHNKYMLTVLQSGNGGPGDHDKGIVVGTGTNTPAATDTALQAKISHGVGAGQLQFGTTDFDAITIVGNVSTFAIKRVLTNNSGAPITVNEFGIYTLGQGGSITRLICIIRDTLVGGRTLNNTQSMEVKYKLSVAA